MEDALLKIEAVKGLSALFVFIAIITYALVERVKAEAPTLKGFWYTLISMGIGAGLFAIFMYAPIVVLGFLFAGLIACGAFDITTYVSGKRGS